VDDPSFYFCWWSAEDGADHLSAATWRKANPGFGDLIDPEDFESAAKRTPEVEFRIKRANQWTQTTEAWLPHGAWKALGAADPAEITDVVLGFDGSYKRDSTALYGFTVGGKPHGFLIGAWEKPDTAGDEWRVPRAEVQKALHETFQRYRVRRLLCDPYRWETEIDEWADTYGDVVLEFPTNSRQRMVKACGRFYSAVVQGDFTHDGDPTIARHLSNVVLKQTPEGSYITKDAADSPRKIDAAVAAVVAWEAAAAFVDDAESEEPLVAWI
jgi:phage terminase large subunit-like protein